MATYSITFPKEVCSEHESLGQCNDGCELIELVFEVFGSVGPYRRARTYGPPDTSSPAEGGDVDITEVWLAGRLCAKSPEDLFNQKELDEIDQMLFDAMMDDDGPDYEPLED